LMSACEADDEALCAAKQISVASPMIRTNKMR
jgi:hypothetical protein